jgi:hypothetical protein
VFGWLIDNGYIAFYEIERTNKSGDKYTSLEVALPVVTADLQFLGMHLRWFKAGEWSDESEEKGSWRYEPKGNPVQPFIIGDFSGVGSGRDSRIAMGRDCLHRSL